MTTLCVRRKGSSTAFLGDDSLQSSPDTQCDPGVSLAQVKEYGGALLHDSVWVLPHTPRNEEQFQWLTTEIVESGGDCMLWKSELPLPGQDDILMGRFIETVTKEYEEILAMLSDDANLQSISMRYQQIKSRDYFQVE